MFIGKRQYLSFWYMHDNHTFSRLVGSTLDELAEWGFQHGLKSPCGSICPVKLITIDENEKTTEKSFGIMVHNRYKMDYQAWKTEVQKWKEALQDIPEVRELIAQGNINADKDKELRDFVIEQCHTKELSEYNLIKHALKIYQMYELGILVTSKEHQEALQILPQDDKDLESLSCILEALEANHEHHNEYEPHMYEQSYLQEINTNAISSTKELIERENKCLDFLEIKKNVTIS